LQSLLKGPERESVLEYCLSRYGVSFGAWDGLELIKRTEGIWILSCSEDESNQDLGLKKFLWENSESQGLRVLSGKRFPYKVTNQFFQIFHQEILKGKIELTEKEALTLLRRNTLETGYEELGKGYYFCLFQERFIGIALKMEEGLVSQVPKSLTGQLSKNLELSDK
jgi:NOL1/NOP2/fmu family ribosome biogenesis protein